MAFLLTQSDRSEIKSLKIEAEGEIAKYLESLLTFATVGALSESVGEKVNYVNASFIANERGIVLETKELANSSGYKNKVNIKLNTSTGLNTISGTVFGENIQRIVEIYGNEVDVEPKGKMILFRNSDVPGVIGDVGKTLGDNNINIADFRLGRNKNGAVAVIIVDNQIDDKILSLLRNLKAAQSVAYAEI